MPLAQVVCGADDGDVAGRNRLGDQFARAEQFRDGVAQVFFANFVDVDVVDA